MGSVVEDIGKFASSVFGGLVKIGTGIVGGFLVLTGNPLGWYLIGVSLGLTFAGSYYEYQKFKKALSKLKQSSTGHLINTRKSNEPLPIVYGECRIGGNVVFVYTDGKNNENLWLAIALCESSINNVLGLQINDYPYFAYVKKTSKEVRIRVSSEIQKVKVYFKYRTLRTNSWGITTWVTIPILQEVAKGGLYSTYEYDVIFYSDTNEVLIRLKSNATFGAGYIWLQNMPVIKEYSIDGQTWEKPFDVKLNYFIKRNNTDTHWLESELIKRGFKPAKDVVYLYAKIVYEEGKWQGIPNLTAIIEGKIVYDPRDNTYKYSTNPALILLDYLTNKRYGFGIDISRIDLNSFIEVANYCDEQGYEYNGIITDGRGIDIIEHILEHFRGYLVYQNGKFKLKIKDLRIETPVATITEDEIIEGTFQINMPDISEIPNAVKVNFINPLVDYKVDSIVIEDVNVSSIEERKEIEINLYGADLVQAKVLGSYYLERARLNLTISFVTSPKYFNLEVGDLFWLDYESYGIENKIFRIVELTPTPEGYCKITAIIEDEKLYNDVVDLDIYEIDLTNILSPDEIIISQNVVLEEVLQKDKDGKLKDWLKISFDDTIPFIDSYEIWIKPENEDWYQYGTVKKSPVMITDLATPKTYYVKVVPVSIFGAKDFNANPEYSITLLGKLLPPPDVEWFTASFLGDRIQLQWSPVEDLDLDGYEIRMGNSWESGTIIATRHKSTTLTINILKEGTYRFWIKAIDTVGNYSKNAKDCEVIVKGIVNRNVVEIFNDEFNGIKNYTFSWLSPVDSIKYLISYNQRTWENMLNVENFTTWQDWINKYFNWFQPVPFISSYETPIYSLPTTLTGRLYQDISFDTVGEGFTWFNINANTNTWIDIKADTRTWLDLLNVGKFEIILYYSTDGNTWYQFTNTAGDVEAQYIKAKINIYHNQIIQSFRFKDFNIYFDMPDKTESGTYNITLGTERVYLNQNFYKIKSIVITSGTDGKYPILVSYTNQYFDIKMSDNGSGIIHYTVIGY